MPKPNNKSVITFCKKITGVLMPLNMLESVGIYNPIICTSINIDGFRMSGGKQLYEETLHTRHVRVVAMQG